MFKSLAACILTLLLGGFGVTSPTFGAPWITEKEVEALVAPIKKEIEAQKYQAALQATAKLLESSDPKAKMIGRSLRVQLQLGMHQPETAAEELLALPVPQDHIAAALHNWLIVQALEHYVANYRWDIQQRERLAGDTRPKDLKSWTIEDVDAEISGRFVSVWQHIEIFEAYAPADFAPFTAAGNYPEEIQPTMRDLITYLMQRYYRNTSFWTPREQNQVEQLNFNGLLNGSAERLRVGMDSEAHPLTKVAYLLAAHEDFHAAKERLGAALEARLQRVQALFDSFTSEEKRRILVDHIEKSLPRFGEVDWIAVARATQGRLCEQSSYSGHLIDAHRYALLGLQHGKDNLGGQMAAALLARVEHPSLSLQSMSVDTVGKRSVAITYKNLQQINFRLVPGDLQELISGKGHYGLQPSQEFLRSFIDKKPTQQWSQTLPPTIDFETHRAYAELPDVPPGLYYLISSTEKSFGSTGYVVGQPVIISDYVIRREPLEKSIQSFGVYRGDRGTPAAGADLLVYQYSYDKGMRVAGKGKTDKSGQVEISTQKTSGQLYAVAKVGDQWTADIGSFWRYDMQRAVAETPQVLFYTDRAIYRPGQTVLWKVQAVYAGRKGIRALTKKTFAVELQDANGEVVATQKVTTNQYGTASGKFEVPVGRALGYWTLASPWSNDSIQVEEYKRPTMKAEFLPTKASLRMNEPASVQGFADYYFGAPVSEGRVQWTVTREPIYRGWWSWYWTNRTRTEVIASGESQVGSDGKFAVNFLPAAVRPETPEERSSVQYNFLITATVTDSGGESTDLSTVLRLGWVDLDVTIVSEDVRYKENKDTVFSFIRRRLSGSPVTGEGKWTLYRLQQPEGTALRLPGRLAGDPKYAVPGDAQRPRWERPASLDDYLASWEVGEVAASGNLKHDEDGKATANLGKLAPTAYRLHYQSKDAFGEAYQVSKDFFVLGKTPDLKLPYHVETSQTAAKIGETVEFSFYSAVKGMPIQWALYQEGRKYKEGTVTPDGKVETVRVKIAEAFRGGFSLKASAIADYLPFDSNLSVYVGWPEKNLDVKFTTIRERLRPGQKEVWKLKIEGQEGMALKSAAEVLALMYDKSLDAFSPHSIPSPISLLPRLHNYHGYNFGLRSHSATWLQGLHDFGHKIPPDPTLYSATFSALSGSGIGGVGRRSRGVMHPKAAQAYSLAEADDEAVLESSRSPHAPAPAEARPEGGYPAKSRLQRAENKMKKENNTPPAESGEPIRSNFNETAIWQPHLISNKDGSVELVFEVPDSVTQWQVYIGAVTQALQYGQAQATVQTVKDLLVRPYLPRFLRAGDENVIRVMVNNTSQEPLSGKLTFAIEDPETGESLTERFGLAPDDAVKEFSVKGGASQALAFALKVPRDLGEIAVRVTGVAGEFGDGELRRLPILPARVHLAQSRFAALTTTKPRELKFALGEDKTRIDDQLVVAVDAQLIGGVLKALPYLATYPYECVEQTLNRFLSASIVESAFGSSPYIKSLAQQMKSRKTQFEIWDETDPNRKMLLEETPWLQQAKGGSDSDKLLNMFDPKVLAKQKASALDKLQKAQLADGGFPWFPGGQPSTYMTLYLLGGFARAHEFGVAVDPEMVARALSYVAQEFRRHPLKDHSLWYLVQFNFVLSSFPDPVANAGLSLKERQTILDFTFDRRKDLPPYLKALLALTLHRMDRHQDAVALLEVIFDTAKVDPDLGLYWAPEDRSWLWYNDTIETHAFALRALTEILPTDQRRKPLVQWLFLNKKLNHWQSTRATAEVLYSLVYYLKQENALGKPETVVVQAGPNKKTFSFSPEVYQGDNVQWVIKENLDSAAAKTVIASKPQGEMAFVTATWHFSTENPPAEGDGDLFAVKRTYFKRKADGSEVKLTNLDDAKLEIGDEIEVHLSIKAKHAAEYVHLRDPRPSGFEPGIVTSGWHWGTGLSYFEEVRDSATNFFFEWVPAGEYTLKYRVRVQGSGQFQAAPATLQSMYAPEFTAYSGSRRIGVE